MSSGGRPSWSLRMVEADPCWVWARELSGGGCCWAEGGVPCAGPGAMPWRARFPSQAWEVLRDPATSLSLPARGPRQIVKAAPGQSPCQGWPDRPRKKAADTTPTCGVGRVRPGGGVWPVGQGGGGVPRGGLGPPSLLAGEHARMTGTLGPEVPTGQIRSVAGPGKWAMGPRLSRGPFTPKVTDSGIPWPAGPRAL